jgi:hypothetical protein
MTKPPWEADRVPWWQYPVLALLCWETYATAAFIAAIFYIS